LGMAGIERSNTQSKKNKCAPQLYAHAEKIKVDPSGIHPAKIVLVNRINWSHKVNAIHACKVLLNAAITF
jgi:hypothetical protein